MTYVSSAAIVAVYKHTTFPAFACTMTVMNNIHLMIYICLMPLFLLLGSAQGEYPMVLISYRYCIPLYYCQAIYVSYYKPIWDIHYLKEIFESGLLH